MAEKLPLNPDVELFRWGPAPMRFYYNSDFEGILTRFPLVFPGECWPQGLFISNGSVMVWVNEYPELRKGGKSVFVHHMLDSSARAKVWGQWLKDLDVLNQWEKKVEKERLSKISKDTFVDLWKEMREILLNFWTNILVPEYGNYGADGILEDELRRYVKNSAELGSVMEILTAPEEPSFFQQEEFDLAKTKDIARHAKKYFWLRNSYNGTEVLPVSFFQERKKELDPNVEENFKARQAEVRKKKSEVRDEYSLPKEVMDIADAFVKGVEWQDSRKAVIWVYLHYKDLMLGEASRRLGISKSDLVNFGTGEILEMLEGKLPSETEVKNRRTSFAVVMKPLKKPVVISGDLAHKYWDLYAEDKPRGDEKELKGIVVSRQGKPVRARVRLLLDPRHADNFEKGEILVVPMTTPEYIFVMKKASAVITDVGGLMSHAAIVSRELGIPCIVGTKIATKVLKDGDMVEVDAERGVVTVIKKNNE